MHFKYNVTGAERKAFVEAVSEIIGNPAHWTSGK